MQNFIDVIKRIREKKRECCRFYSIHQDSKKKSNLYLKRKKPSFFSRHADHRTLFDEMRTTRAIVVV